MDSWRTAGSKPGRGQTPAGGRRRFWRCIALTVATVTGKTAADNYVLGYTPQIAGGVRVEAEPGETLDGVHVLNGAAPIWHALMRYASRNLPPEDWPTPLDVTELDRCAPSGYL